ncbi:MAG: MazG family protein [Acidimicrobiaceae bacterium]|nr:MazG family protein [Acidimicrobiaceae bacterium]MYE08021.1 MazG family protein [Acidimicrobiaceae bacterium]MYI35656.1 MazG family protein [Acidimicrobiaceae bacterium]
MLATGTGTPSSSGLSLSRSPDGSVGVSGDADGEVGPDQLDDNLSVAILRLDELVRTLREQCPWDREQTHMSLRRYLLEETYETLEALDARAGVEAGGGADVEDLDQHLCEELGDLLYQVWFQAHLASERGAFDIAEVAQQVRRKLVARHPHVFGDVEASDADAVRGMWDAIKLEEKGRDSVMDGIPSTLPALLSAVKVQKRAATAGLLAGDSAEGEFGETEQALAELRADRSEHSFGELLLAAVELGRRLKVDPEDALRSATERAQRHYRALEQADG